MVVVEPVHTGFCALAPYDAIESKLTLIHGAVNRARKSPVETELDEKTDEVIRRGPESRSAAGRRF